MKILFKSFLILTSLQGAIAQEALEARPAQIHSQKFREKTEVKFLNQLWNKWDDKNNQVSFTDLNTKDWNEASALYQSWRQKEIESGSTRKQMPPTLYELIKELGFEGSPRFLPTLLRVYFCLDGINAMYALMAIQRNLYQDPAKTLLELDAQFMNMKKTKDSACVTSKADLDELHAIFSASLSAAMEKKTKEIPEKKRAEYKAYRIAIEGNSEILKRMEPIYEVTDKIFGYTPKLKK